MSEAVHAEFTAGMDTRQYESAVKRMGSEMTRVSAGIIADMERTRKATDALTSSATNAQRRLHAMGNASAQIQDMAVQLQGGTKALTVFTQQVPQLLSAFGPHATIAATVIAIGAGIYTWVSGAKDAEEQLKAVERQAKKAQQAIESLQSGAATDRQAAARATGKEEGIEERFANRMGEISEKEKLIKFGDKEGNAAVAEARKSATARRDAELDEERRKQQKKFDDEVGRVSEQGFKEREKFQDRELQGSERMMQLAKEIGESQEKLNSGKLNTLEYEEEALRMAKAQNAIVEQARDLHNEGLETQRKQVQEAKNWREQFDKTVEAADDIEKARKKVGELEKSISQEQQKQAISTRAATGNQIAKTPAEERAERKAEREQDKRDRTEAKREADRQDREARKQGSSGLTKKERADIEREAIEDQRKGRGEKKLVAEISDDNITKLKKELADAVKELIPK